MILPIAINGMSFDCVDFSYHRGRYREPVYASIEPFAAMGVEPVSSKIQVQEFDYIEFSITGRSESLDYVRDIVHRRDSFNVSTPSDTYICFIDHVEMRLDMMGHFIDLKCIVKERNPQMKWQAQMDPRTAVQCRSAIVSPRRAGKTSKALQSMAGIAMSALEEQAQMMAAASLGLKKEEPQSEPPKDSVTVSDVESF